MAEGAYESCPRAPIVENRESGFSVPHGGLGMPRGRPVLSVCPAGGGPSTATSDGLAGLARLRFSGCGIVVDATENLANPDGGRVCRICSV
jgi:hypothetical protein